MDPIKSNVSHNKTWRCSVKLSEVAGSYFRAAPLLWLGKYHLYIIIFNGSFERFQRRCLESTTQLAAELIHAARNILAIAQARWYSLARRMKNPNSPHY